GFAAFAARRLLTYLHIFQQEEYDGPRFLRWLWREGAFDRRLSVALVALFVVELVLAGWLPRWVFAALVGLCCLGAAAIERDPRKTAKKPLAMTARAKRIFGIALALAAAIGIVAALASEWVL